MQVTTTQQLDIVPCGLDHDHDPHPWQDEVEGIPADWYWCDGSAFAADFADLQQ
ncbi:hypothetical protein [Actinophytocola sp.]|uniref:hypothetical protein n=1 Tax=Actinophytocola sp. TaxID=1872138 RepID=UPI002D4A83F2|nr:hypothetical protein [Actinophytocola sp.]HYQ62546.1 hypothetical protein [Actinophytocola sp.]